MNIRPSDYTTNVFDYTLRFYNLTNTDNSTFYSAGGNNIIDSNNGSGIHNKWRNGQNAAAHSGGGGGSNGAIKQSQGTTFTLPNYIYGGNGGSGIVIIMIEGTY
jgi:hypothetical protein